MLSSSGISMFLGVQREVLANFIVGRVHVTDVDFLALVHVQAKRKKVLINLLDIISQILNSGKYRHLKITFSHTLSWFHI
jgi:hypothetical protein